MGSTNEYDHDWIDIGDYPLPMNSGVAMYIHEITVFVKAARSTRGIRLSSLSLEMTTIIVIPT